MRTHDDLDPADKRVLVLVDFNVPLERPDGSERTLVSYEARAHGTDGTSRRGFARYWRSLSPSIGVVTRSQLRIVADQAAPARRRSL